MSSEVSTAVAESGVSNAGVSTAVAKTISSVAPEARVAKSGVAVSVVGIGLSIGLSLSLPLGNVDSSDRVGTVVAGGGVAVGDVGTNGGGGGNGQGRGGDGSSVDSRGGVGVVDGSNRGS